MLECSGALAHVPPVDKLSELSSHSFLLDYLKNCQEGKGKKNVGNE